MASIIPGYEYDTCLPAGRSSSAIAKKIIKETGGSVNLDMIY
ncbi:MAG: hypothetical protein ABR927_15250 [Bacteroidales bacterium]|jgi:hypothetical protein